MAIRGRAIPLWMSLPESPLYSDATTLEAHTEGKMLRELSFPTQWLTSETGELEPWLCPRHDYERHIASNTRHFSISGPAIEFRDRLELDLS